jgi:dsRNA-specific ribonuclease
MPKSPDPVKEFADAGDLVFQDPSLLRMALTHRSYLNEHPDRERTTSA